MTQQLINLGTAANNGTGDNLRSAMDKTNDNFTELYGANSVSSNLAQFLAVKIHLAAVYVVYDIQQGSDIMWSKSL